jgi:CheY-like chemotaxis protein
MLVLIIDDDPEDSEIFCDAIATISASIKCLGSKSSEDALVLLNQNMDTLPDLIFLDINMPKMDGRECLVEIKKNKHLEHIPVVMYSTSASYKDLDFFKRMNIKFMEKPSSFDDLVNELREFLSSLEGK